MEYALSEEAKVKIMNLKPLGHLSIIDQQLNEVTEGRRITDSNYRAPIANLKGVNDFISKIEKGSVLDPSDLNNCQKFLAEGKKMIRFMENKDTLIPVISGYALSISKLSDIEEEIINTIVGNSVADCASSNLHRIRKRMKVQTDRIQEKLNQYMRSHATKDYIQDSVVGIRNGRFVLSVKATSQSLVNGSVLDKSQSGSTVFIELESTRKLQEEVNLLKIKESEEEYKILSELTNRISLHLSELKINFDCLIHYDFIFAKSKYSKSIQGTAIRLNDKGAMNINRGRHPLLGSEAVPLNMLIPKSKQGLLITGPNTGGKTVTLKTVGLLTLMTQCGLHGSANEGTELINFDRILCDIGDGQDLEQSLSTFSSHITNIVEIIEQANSNTLVILDEVGTGTDPIEGMGLAISILKTLYNKKAKIFATTHFSELKNFALHHDGFENGSMAFDLDTLKPKYELIMGESGASNAFLIALRLGLSKEIVEDAYEISYEKKKDYTGVLENMLKKQKVLSEKPKDIIINEEVIIKRKTDIEKGKFHDFKIGDMVYIPILKTKGVVVDLEDRKGDLTIMIKKKRTKINYKRIKSYIDKKDLYPDDYDMDIVTKTIDHRKKDHHMNRGKGKDMVIEH